MSLKHQIIQFLKADTGVSALVGDRISPRRAPAKSAYPHLIVNRISELEGISHSGDASYIQTRLQISVLSKTDRQSEDIRKAITQRLHLFQGTLGTVQVFLCTLEDSGDSLEDEYFEQDVLFSYMDFNIDWRNV